MSSLQFHSTLMNNQQNMNYGIGNEEDGNQLTSPTHSILSFGPIPLNKSNSNSNSNVLREKETGHKKICSDESIILEMEMEMEMDINRESSYDDIDYHHNIHTSSTSVESCVSSCTNNINVNTIDGETISSPDLFNTLYSIVGENDDDNISDDHGVYSSNVQSDSSIRYDTPHDVDVVSWDRMDGLMNTYEYGAWMSR